MGRALSVYELCRKMLRIETVIGRRLSVCVCVYSRWLRSATISSYYHSFHSSLILHFGRAKVARIHAQRHACTRTGHGRGMSMSIALPEATTATSFTATTATTTNNATKVLGKLLKSASATFTINKHDKNWTSPKRKQVSNTKKTRKQNNSDNLLHKFRRCAVILCVCVCLCLSACMCWYLLFVSTICCRAERAEQE